MTNQSLGSSTIDEATRNQIYGGIDKYMAFFHIMPYVLFFVVVIYMIVVAIRKEESDKYNF